MSSFLRHDREEEGGIVEEEDRTSRTKKREEEDEVDEADRKRGIGFAIQNLLLVAFVFWDLSNCRPCCQRGFSLSHSYCSGQAEGVKG